MEKEQIDISRAFIEASKLRVKKREDYGDDLDDYFPFGAESYCHELHKKTKRLVNLVKTKKDPKYESVEDNLLDLINYASFYYEWLVEGDHFIISG